MKENESENDLILKCKGGGSIIDRKPVFSPNGLSLIIPWRSLLRSFSTITGERITDYDGAEDDIVAAAFNPNNSKILMACSSSGEVLCWKWKTELLVSKNKLNISMETLNSFHVLKLQEPADEDTCEMIVSWCENSENHVALFKSNNSKLVEKLPLKIKSKNYCLDVGGKLEGSFVAVIEHNKLHCIKIKNSKKCLKFRTGSGRTFSCVQCHPELECVATGDSSGRVVVWQALFSGAAPAQAVYHWHTLPVRCLAFSAAGGALYSAGDERVLVKWSLGNPHNKEFLPRLAASVAQLAVSPDGLCVAAGTEDNGVLVVDARLRTRCSVQQLAWPTDKLPFPAGMQYDAHSRALLLNGRAGHLQFYSPHDAALLYNLDVLGQNQVSRERATPIANTAVVLIALGGGGWLATVERRAEDGLLLELRLKFWRRDDQLRSYVLDTSVEMPHDGGLTALQFQPGGGAACVTAGADRRFKLWSHSAAGWGCDYVGYHRELQPTALDFSPDGSVLAVAFDSCLTLWLPDSCRLKASLAHPHHRQALRHVRFGNADQCHLLVCASDTQLCVWNLLTLGLVWTVPVRISFLCKDPTTTCMAAATVSDSLFVFEPISPKLVWSRKQVVGADKKMLCGAWVPEAGGAGWQRGARLHLLTSGQELVCLEQRRERLQLPEPQDTARSPHPPPPPSALAALLPHTHAARTQHTHKRALPPSHTHVTFAQLLISPVHAMAPMRLLCSSVLRSALRPASVPAHSEDSTDEDVPELEHHERASEDDDSGTRRRRLCVSETADSDRGDHTPLQNVFAESASWASILV